MSFLFQSGSQPLLISFPHNGSWIPPEISANMTPAGRTSRDTDWHLDRLYELPETAEASWLVAEISRYVIDLNRPTNNQSLYPGQTTTDLIPELRFDGEAIYAFQPPNPLETAVRIQEIWQPYHQKIEAELKRLVEEFGFAILIDAHSIASRVPRLFEGKLLDFNLGTNFGQSCDISLVNRLIEILQIHPQYSFVLNGRFVGGYITRHFGKPQQGVHAVQIELSQATYLDERYLTWDDVNAHRVQQVFRDLFTGIQQWRPQ